MFRPLGNKVLVQEIKEEQKTASGIYVPSQDYLSVKKGKVIAAGKGAVTMSGDLIEMEVSEGDVVMFKENQGTEIRVGTDTYLVFHETDLLGILS